MANSGTLAGTGIPENANSQTTNTDLTLGVGDLGSVLLVDSSAALRTITLPQANTVGSGGRFFIVATSANVNPVAIALSGTDTVNNGQAGPFSLATLNASVICISNGNDAYAVFFEGPAALVRGNMGYNTSSPATTVISAPSTFTDIVDGGLLAASALNTQFTLVGNELRYDGVQRVFGVSYIVVAEGVVGVELKNVEVRVAQSGADIPDSHCINEVTDRSGLIQTPFLVLASTDDLFKCQIANLTNGDNLAVPCYRLNFDPV